MPQPGLEPGSSDPESSTLTTGLLTPHSKKKFLTQRKLNVNYQHFTVYCALGHLTAKEKLNSTEKFNKNYGSNTWDGSVFYKFVKVQVK